MVSPSEPVIGYANWVKNHWPKTTSRKHRKINWRRSYLKVEFNEETGQNNHQNGRESFTLKSSSTVCVEFKVEVKPRSTTSITKNH
jgi:hypothetical protein